MQSKTELNLCYSFLWATKKWRARVCECFPFPRSSQGLCASDFVVTHHFNLIVHLEVVPFIKRYIFNICMMVSSSDNNSFFLAFQGENTTLKARYYRALYDVARIETTWGRRKKKEKLANEHCLRNGQYRNMKCSAFKTHTQPASKLRRKNLATPVKINTLTNVLFSRCHRNISWN